jgi:hypothetical protein
VTGEAVAGALPVCKVLLVGELNPHGADPRLVLYHLPRHSSGNRLRLILGLTDLEYHRLLDRVNLCDGRWSAGAARERLTALVDARAPGGVVVLLGARVRATARRLVRDTFGVDFKMDFFSVVDAWSGPRHRRLVYLPHPSGLNRLWNEPGSVTRARRLLAEVAPWVHWGACADELPPPRPARGEVPGVGTPSDPAGET